MPAHLPAPDVHVGGAGTAGKAEHAGQDVRARRHACPRFVHGPRHAAASGCTYAKAVASPPLGNVHAGASCCFWLCCRLCAVGRLPAAIRFRLALSSGGALSGPRATGRVVGLQKLVDALKRDAQEAPCIPLAQPLGEDSRSALHSLPLPLHRLACLFLRLTHRCQGVSHVRGKHWLDLDRDLLGLHIKHHRDRLTSSLVSLLQALGLAEDARKIRHLKSPPFADAPRSNAVGAHRHHPFPSSSSNRLQIDSAVISLTSP